MPDLAVLYPAHGEAITAPYRRMRELYAHREERTRQALEALQRGPERIGPLVTRIYTDTDPALHPAAAQSLLAHLLALEKARLVARAPGSETASWDEIVWRLKGD